MSRPLKTPSMRWEFAFCSSGYVLVLLYTLGALGLNCEREQRWRRFRNTAAAPRTPLSLVLVEAPPSRPSLGRKDQGGGCAAPRGAAPGRCACGACAPEPPRSRARSGHATRAQGRARRRRQWWWLVSGSGAVTGVARSGRCGRVSRTASGCGGVAQSPRPGGPASSSYEISGPRASRLAHSKERTALP